MSGLPYSTVNSLLRGKSDSPNLKTLIRIATAFNMTIVEFLDVPEITDGVGMRLREVLPKGLSPQEQEILLLRFEERLSYSEIADVLKIKEVSCRSRLMRAKAHLLNLYEKEKIL